MSDRDPVDVIRQAAVWFEPAVDGFGTLDVIGDATLVLIGEASHGTHEEAILSTPWLERAIGVIYRPDSERVSHYFTARVAQQFDAILHIDDTHALEPLEPWSVDEADLPETYPSAL